ncbi:protein FAM170B-like, partial [Haliotis cracherodii]|uniref:protein FAM170B-like n=1 Tax=Haliotis cracherodii TaxID=6455 RepID=UPI0039EB1E04
MEGRYLSVIFLIVACVTCIVLSEGAEKRAEIEQNKIRVTDHQRVRTDTRARQNSDRRRMTYNSRARQHLERQRQLRQRQLARQRQDYRYKQRLGSRNRQADARRQQQQQQQQQQQDGRQRPTYKYNPLKPPTRQTIPRQRPVRLPVRQNQPRQTPVRQNQPRQTPVRQSQPRQLYNPRQTYNSRQQQGYIARLPQPAPFRQELRDASPPTQETKGSPMPDSNPGFVLQTGMPNVCPYQDVEMVMVRQPCVQAFTRLVKVWKPNCGYTHNWCVGYER